MGTAAINVPATANPHVLSSGTGSCWLQRRNRGNAACIASMRCEKSGSNIVITRLAATSEKYTMDPRRAGSCNCSSPVPRYRFTAVNLYLGTGLLQLQEPARLGSIVYFSLVAANLVITMLLPDFSQRMLAMQAAFPRFLRWSQQEPVPLDSTWGFAVAGTLMAAVPIWFLVRRKAAFARS